MATTTKLIARTHTVNEFIGRKYEDEITYRNFSIVEYADGIELINRNLISEYIDILLSASISYTFTVAEYNKYKYAPDLLSYDLYKTTQLDFVIMLLNDMVDPKEFTLKTVKLPNANVLRVVLSDIMSVNSGFIAQNRADNNLVHW